MANGTDAPEREISGPNGARTVTATDGRSRATSKRSNMTRQRSKGQLTGGGGGLSMREAKDDVIMRAQEMDNMTE